MPTNPFSPVIDCVCRVHGYPWKPISNGQCAVALSGLAGLFALLATDDDGFMFLDHVNLVFHEAGHPLFGIFGETMGLYGGTLGQLAVPFLVWLAFWRQRDALGCTVAGVWFFENFLNVARYMADARAQALPLVGGGEHDWEQIFGRWGVLASDTVIAHRVAVLGWIGMLAMCAWLGWRWYRSGRHDFTPS
jgi:hypothetical protein